LGEFPYDERPVHRASIRIPAETAHFRHSDHLARPLLIVGYPADRLPDTDLDKEFDMQVLNNKLAAAVFSLAFSLVMFATAIAPANQGTLLPGVLA
jgi:hypothetical protein